MLFKESKRSFIFGAVSCCFINAADRKSEELRGESRFIGAILTSRK